MDDRTDPQYKLRMPPELRDKLKAVAAENHRSMNAEMVARLLESFEPREVKLDEETRRELLTQLFVEFAEEGLRRMLEEREK